MLICVSKKIIGCSVGIKQEEGPVEVGKLTRKLPQLPRQVLTVDWTIIGSRQRVEKWTDLVCAWAVESVQ